MSVRRIAVSLFGSVLAVLAGCSPAPTSELPPVPDLSRSVASAEELSGNWVVYAIGRRPLSGVLSPRMAFAIDERVGGMAGCNRFLGEYHLNDEGELHFDEMRVTRRICSEPIMHQETLLLSRLRAVDRGHLTPSGDLLLYYDADNLPIRLHREEARLSETDDQAATQIGNYPG